MRPRFPALALTGGIILMAASHAQNPPNAENPIRISAAEARRTVDLLHDVYVNSVVMTHSTYVKDAATPPAATVARRLFEAVAAKGWTQTRWMNNRARALNPAHNPRDEFERSAAEQLLKGSPRVEKLEGDRLRIALPVPLADRSCQTCHPKDAVGDPVGALVYTVALLKE